MVPTIEQFIEKCRADCRRNAELTVKNRYKQKMAGEVSDENELGELAKRYILTPEGKAEVEAALGSGRLYKCLSVEKPETEPKVVDAYCRFLEGIENTERTPKKAKRKKKKKKSKENKKLRLEEYYKEFLKYSFTEDDLKLAVSLAGKEIVDYYSDINCIFPSKFLKEACGEFTNETLLGRFNNRLYDEAVLNSRRIDNVIYFSDYPCRDLGELFYYIAAVRVLETCEVGDSTKRSMIREYVDRGRSSCMFRAAAYSMIAEQFPRKRMTEIITSGAEYQKAVAYMQEQIKLAKSAHEMILREIPEDVTMLYPRARSIKRHFTLHLGPTNSGKTYSSLLACRQAETGVYLAPLRLLAYEICEGFNRDGVPCRMITGEERIDVPFATHTSSTVEMLNINEHYDVAVVDECQLIEDEERGGAWTAAVLGVMADEVHLCASENAKKILISLIELCGDSYDVVMHKRSVPLECDPRDFVFPKSVEKKDALIAFTKRSVLSYAERLREYGIKASVIYGDLPYDVRRSEVSRFVNGETSVVVATDAVGMGLNLPIKRVVFLEAYKYDGKKRRFLHGTEVKQIAGRAGRMGQYEVGYYNAADYKPDIIRKLHKKSHDVERARLRIPESIISVDMPLSEILLRWGTIPDAGIFTKNTVEREVMLSRELEKYTSDKLLVYRFVTIPFSETRRELYELWFGLFMREVSGDRTSVFTYTEEIERRGDDLESHELAYRKCDILYFYYDRFGVKDDLDVIMQLKRSISADIKEILSGDGAGEGGGTKEAPDDNGGEISG